MPSADDAQGGRHDVGCGYLGRKWPDDAPARRVLALGLALSGGMESRTRTGPSRDADALADLALEPGMTVRLAPRVRTLSMLSPSDLFESRDPRLTRLGPAALMVGSG